MMRALSSTTNDDIEEIKVKKQDLNNHFSNQKKSNAERIEELDQYRKTNFSDKKHPPADRNLNSSEALKIGSE